MLKPLTLRQETLIVNNVVSACSDIEKLKYAGYNFIMLSSGFIAHYNIYGFISHYSSPSLRGDILQYAQQNKWTNFRPSDENYEYYSQKARIYQKIVDKLNADRQ